MKYPLLLTLLCCALAVQAQDKQKAAQRIQDLGSQKLAGRGYIDNGDKKAADYIAKALKNAHLKPFGKSYFQPLGFIVNTFPAQTDVAFDGQTLKPGTDFIVDPAFPGLKGKYQVHAVTEAELADETFPENITLKYEGFPALLIDTFDLSKEPQASRIKKLRRNYTEAPVILLQKKLTWSVAQGQSYSAFIEVNRAAISQLPKKLEVNVKAVLVRHATQNVAACVKGTQYPDSFLVYTAHYDHLGKMGKNTWFPGANDNASGIAMLLDLAEYFSANPPKHSVAFIAFCGEEAGLVGSKYYTENPLFPLEQIKFLVNLDLMGTGDEGIMAVNGEVFAPEYAMLEQVNQQHQYLPVVKKRGKAANSDHYFFSEKGVHCFFFYLMGSNYSYYHDVNDRPENLPLSRYNEAFKLIRDFMLALDK